MTLNGAETIFRTLQSIRSQNYANLEHVIIDGGSKDGTLDVIDKYKVSNTILISEKDYGLYDAMNKGLKLASGDIICFLNSNDYYADDNILDVVVENFSNANCDIVFGDVEYFDKNRIEVTVRRYNSSSFSPEKLYLGWMPAHPSLFLRRSIVQSVGLFKSHYTIAGDFDYIARIFKENLVNFKYLHKVLVRMETGGISSSGLRSKITLNREILRSCRENSIKTNYFNMFRRYLSKMWEYTFFG